MAENIIGSNIVGDVMNLAPAKKHTITQTREQRLAASVPARTEIHLRRKLNAIKPLAEIGRAEIFEHKWLQWRITLHQQQPTREIRRSPELIVWTDVTADAKGKPPVTHRRR